jgi:hypothetical protein
MIEAAKPESEIEAALVIQMACTHSAAMAVLSKIGGAHWGRSPRGHDGGGRKQATKNICNSS